MVSPWTFSKLKIYSTPVPPLERCFSPSHLHDLPLDSVQQEVKPFLRWGHSTAGEVPAGQRCRISPAGHTALDAAQDMFGFLGREHSFQVYVSLSVTKFIQAVLHPGYTSWSSNGPTPHLSWSLWMPSFPSSMSPVQFHWMPSGNFLRVPSVPLPTSLTKMFNSIGCHQFLRNIIFHHTLNIELSILQILKNRIFFFLLYCEVF